mmetsp:Transcript_99573/g.281770  ORF Transcript_99573/g.281770 Transcript_99573/m.281770 type:complete len:270 (-) Transcript_99573:73-882(-)
MSKRPRLEAGSTASQQVASEGGSPGMAASPLPSSDPSAPGPFHRAPVDIGPSLLACDLANLEGESRMVLGAGADSLHVDVMDGHFVPNMSWGMPVVASLHKAVPEAFLDVHLMVSNPEQWVLPMRDSGAGRYTFHFEATEDPEALVAAIRDAGMKPGICVKPGTPVCERVLSVARTCDLILIMTVEPGFGGQSFMESMMGKVRLCREQLGPEFNIQVDGGLSAKTVDFAAKAGANCIVAGSAVFKKDPPPRETILAMRNSVEKWGHGKE